MNRIKFTSGTVSKLNADYYHLELFHGSDRVYIATIPRVEACNIVSKHFPKIQALS